MVNTPAQEAQSLADLYSSAWYAVRRVKADPHPPAAGEMRESAATMLRLVRDNRGYFPDMPVPGQPGVYESTRDRTAVSPEMLRASCDRLLMMLEDDDPTGAGGFEQVCSTVEQACGYLAFAWSTRAAWARDSGHVQVRAA